ncbi:MAG: class C sortase [Ruminococcus sp.]|nr:class C sortase [Ruminococcus sp.]
MKKTTKIMIFICLLGLSLLLYPTVSDLWNSMHSTRAITEYSDSLDKINAEEYRKMWNDALEYNSELNERENPFALSDAELEKYNSLLDPDGQGIMGYIEIPCIGVQLPIYHGTEENVLQVAVGHIDWTSLPTGGEGNHCVLSGHRGLRSAVLFTDLDKMREGDTFELNILNEKMTYEVDMIRTVEPDEADELKCEKGKDYCTLVTCTPYGINTQRLLVRGHRIENKNSGTSVISEAVIIDEIVVAGFLAIPIIFILFMMVMLKKPQPKKQNTEINFGEENE